MLSQFPKSIAISNSEHHDINSLATASTHTFTDPLNFQANVTLRYVRLMASAVRLSVVYGLAIVCP